MDAMDRTDIENPDDEGASPKALTESLISENARKIENADELLAMQANRSKHLATAAHAGKDTLTALLASIVYDASHYATRPAL